MSMFNQMPRLRRKANSDDNLIPLINNELVSFAELPNALTDLLLEHPADVAVRADKQVTYQDLDKVLNTLRSAGFSTINLFTLTTEPS